MASSSPAAPKLPGLTITSPLLRDKYYIDKDAVWPSVVFQTDAAVADGEELAWEWSIAWGRFTDRGVANTVTSWWDAQAAITDRGGTLAVTAARGALRTASVSVEILGTQPDEGDVQAYLATIADSGGFDRILKHETCSRHFDASGHPMRSFDNGFGMAQLTNPAPDYGQVWNWKRNVDAGVRLFAQKRALATAYLSRRAAPSEAQLVRETVSRWNGGSYHVWNPRLGWIRKPAILCDSKTGNIGWDLSKPCNAGLNEAQLHHRDAGYYAHAPVSSGGWGYFGVCYADSVLGAQPDGT